MTHIYAKSGRFLGAATAALLIAGFAYAGVEIDVGGTKVSASSMTFSISHQPVYDPETYIPVEPKRSQLYAGAVYVSRNLDGASINVLRHVVDGTSIPAVTIEMTRDGSTDRQVWNLANAVFNNYSTYTGEDSLVIENFDISYDTATLQVFKDGATTPTDTLSWAAPQSSSAPNSQ